MKKLAAVALSLFLTSGIAFADTPKDADPQPAKPAKPAAKAAKKKTATEILAEQVEALRLSMEAQQQEIKADQLVPSAIAPASVCASMPFRSLLTT